MSQAEQVAALEHELEPLKMQLPKHGLKPSTLARIDDLEEEIAALKTQRATTRESQNDKSIPLPF